MGQQMLLLAAARSKTVRRTVGAVIALIALPFVAVLVPVVAVPLVLASNGAAATGGSRPTVVGEWGYPLAGDYFKGRGFGWHPVAGCAYCNPDHHGYDMSQECGATIYAAGPGAVIQAGDRGGLGDAVEIDHGGGITTVYGHMSWGSLLVQRGDQVTAGTPLGSEGKTGTSFGCHLHFEVRVDGARVPPEPFMADRGLPLK